MHSYLGLRCFALFLWMFGTVFASATAGDAGRALIIDYELYPPEYSNAVIRRAAAAGLTVDFRDYDPVLTEADLARHRMIILESTAGVIGSGIEPSPNEVAALVRFVAGGGLLVLGVPQDFEAFSQLPSYNAILDGLGSGIRVLPAVADDESGRYPSTMFPQCHFRACDAFAAKGVQADKLVLDRATILETKPPALVLARSSPTAFARISLGRDLKKDVPTPKEGFPLVALSRCGQGYVLVIPRFTLNIGGFTGRIGVGPVTSLDWLPASERFVQNILDEMVKLSRGDVKWSGPPGSAITPDSIPKPTLPAAPPKSVDVTTVPPHGSYERLPDNPEARRAAYRATVRRDLYGDYLDHGIRAGWGEMERDDAWINQMAERFKKAGFNYVWGTGWPERFASNEYTPVQRAKLRHAWETFATALDGSPVGWTIGVNFPGVGFDRGRYEKCRGVKGQLIDILSPLDLRYWYEVMIPSLEEVAAFGLVHPSVKGATIDFEMYGYDPFKIYPQAIGFEDVAFSAFLRAAVGHLDEQTLAGAASVRPEQRYEWLRMRGLLRFYFLLLETESEKLGRLIRRRIHAIDPDFIFGAYQAALPDTWFYRGLIRGLSTPEMPMIWMCFQGISAPDVDRFWNQGRHILNASAVMLGTVPIREYPEAMLAGRRFHDGYWINRYNWLLDDAKGAKSIEIPDGSREDAWKALTEGNRRIDEYDRRRAVNLGRKPQ